MFITITGELGSGKSTAAKLLSEAHGFEMYSTGSIQREIAKEKGISTLELNRQMTNDIHNVYDKMIDEKTVELSRANLGKDIVFDSRMAWHFVEQSFKVYVTVDAFVAANRVMAAGRGQEEQYGSLQEAAKALMKRKQLEDVRFAELYHVQTTDLRNYDLIVDSTSIAPDALAEFILEKAKDRTGNWEVYLSPQRLFPTVLMQEEEGTADCPVEVLEENGFYFILRGHSVVCEKIRQKEPLVLVRVRKPDENGYVESCQKSVGEIIEASDEYYAGWEKRNGMKFLGYPKRW